MQPDTRKLLTTGTLIFGSGAIAAISITLFFGGIGRQGPHTNMGWLALMVAMGCLPIGTFSLILGLWKLVGDSNR